jgi:hypothetical protein
MRALVFWGLELVGHAYANDVVGGDAVAQASSLSSMLIL